jgi:hypothetical protein
MSQSRTSRALLSLLVLAAAATPSAAAGLSSEPLRIHVPSHAGTAVRRALRSAKRRLAGESCRLVLTDFNANAQGSSLEVALERLGRTPGAHLDSLVFKDGSGRPRCSRPGILAFTHVGSDTVYVCSGSFRRAAERDPAFAEIVLIHEALHTLGLRENPPTSAEITARVAQRCGD